MDTVPNEDIVTAAIIALRPCLPATAEQAVDLLLFWRRRDELTVADVAEVCARMFPQPLERMECPAWCTHDHSRETPNVIDDLSDHYRDLLVEHDESGRIKFEVAVHVTDSLTDRIRGEAGIRVYADEPLSPAEARRMVSAIEQGLSILGR